MSSWGIQCGLVYVAVYVAIVYLLTGYAVGTYNWFVIAGLALIGALLPAVLSGIWLAKKIEEALKPTQLILCGALIFMLSLGVLAGGEVLTRGLPKMADMVIVLLIIWVPTALQHASIFVGVLWITRCVTLKEISLSLPKRRVMRAVLVHVIVAAVLFYPAVLVTWMVGLLHDTGLVGVLTLMGVAAGIFASRDYAKHHSEMLARREWAIFALAQFGIASVVVGLYVSMSGALFGLIQGGPLAFMFFVVSYSAWVVPAVSGFYGASLWFFSISSVSITPQKRLRPQATLRSIACGPCPI